MREALILLAVLPGPGQTSYTITINGSTLLTLSREWLEFVSIPTRGSTFAAADYWRPFRGELARKPYTERGSSEEVSYALDNCGGIANSMGVGNGQFLHPGGIHSPAPRPGDHCCAGARYSRSKACCIARYQRPCLFTYASGVSFNLGRNTTGSI